MNFLKLAFLEACQGQKAGFVTSYMAFCVEVEPLPKENNAFEGYGTPEESKLNIY